MRRILITGGAGFIGSNLIRALGESDDVLVVDNFHPQVHREPWTPPETAARVTVVEGDVSVPEDMAEAADFRPDLVVHLAAETGTGQSLLESRRHALVNVVGTATLLDAMSSIEHTPSRVVLTSSRAVYGDGQWRGEDGEIFYGEPRTREDLDAGRWLPRSPDGGFGSPLPHDADQAVPVPTNVYAATKLTQEHVLSTWCRAFGSDLAVLRLQNVYGPGQAVHNSYTGVLTYFARQALDAETINVYEEGGIIRDFVHVRDVVAALRQALDAPGRLDCTVDIGSGAPMTLLEVAVEVARAAGAPEPRISQDYRMGDVRAAWAVVEPASKILGYEPQVPFAEGVRSVLDWVGRSR